MYRLRRMYLDSIGIPTNRFLDVMAEFTDSEGNPGDSIVWLRNGAGKTTMISLLLALIRPARREFLAGQKKNNRALEDLVLSADTAHVVAEWVGPGGELLLTGAVYEWNNRHRPHDYNTKGKAELKRSWWCLTPDPEIDGATLDTLPFTRRTAGAYDRAQFCAHIHSLAGQGLSAFVGTDSITNWHTALRERHFDPGLFEYFLVVNAAEGGMDKMFENIDSPGRFVQYLLRFVVNHERMQEVRGMLKNNAEQVAKRPLYQAEKDFCDQAQSRLHELDVTYCDRRDAHQALDIERQRAAQYRTALHNEAKTAQTAAEAAYLAQTSLQDALREIRSAADMHRARGTYYRFRTAEFTLGTAEATLRTAEEADSRARNTVAAWQAVDAYLELENRRKELELANTALAEKTETARPLQAALQSAKAELAGALVREIDSIAVHLANLSETDQQYKDQADAARERYRQAQARKHDLEAEQNYIHQAINDFTEKLERQTALGYPTQDESLLAASHRLRARIEAARSRQTQLRESYQSKQGARDAADDSREQAHDAASRAQQNLDNLQNRRNLLAARAATISDNPRLRALLQTGHVDLLHESADAMTALEQAIAATEQRTFELKERVAAGDRALHALTSESLLPPRIQVQQILDELDAAGITAVSGWQYLAKNIPADKHHRVIAELPAVADGIVVYSDDLASVAAKIINPVDELVVIASVSVFDGHPETQFVLGPAAAQHDHGAAAQELQARTLAHQQLRASLDALDRQFTDDSQLFNQIRALHAELPEDGWAALETDLAASRQQLAIAKAEEAAAKDRLATVREELKSIEAELHAIISELAAIEQTLPVIDELYRTEVDVIMPSRRRLTDIPAQIAAADAVMRQADSAETAARDYQTEIRAKAQLAEHRRTQWRSELNALPPPQTTTTPLETARTAVRLAEDQLRENFPESELRAQIVTAEHRTAEASQRWESRAEHIREIAEQLVTQPDAAEPASRHAAERRAAEAAAESARLLAQARIDKDSASSTFEERRAGIGKIQKTRKDDDREEPSDIAHAEALAALADRQLDELEAQRWQHDQEIDIYRTRETDQQQRAQLLTDQSERLRQIDPAPVDDTGVSVPEDEQGLREAVNALLVDLDAAAKLLGEAQEAFETCADQLSNWARDDHFTKVADDPDGQAVRQIREMLRDRTRITHAAPSAADLAEDLALRAIKIADQIEAVERARTVIVSRMTDRVADALQVLGRASALSELPAGIGAWDHKHFLDVAPKSRPSHEQMGLRIGDLIDRMVNSGKTEHEPAELIWLATDAAVPEGFRATVLKPDPEQPTNRVPVTDMQKWSGGENLTASLVLFCVLARLRAEKRTDKTATVGGLLPLDNPISRASLRQFVELQRKVAHANGVQLVFWTGLGDLSAISAFPRTVAMHKKSARTDRAYVVIDDEHSTRMEVDSITAVRRDP